MKYLILILAILMTVGCIVDDKKSAGSAVSNIPFDLVTSTFSTCVMTSDPSYIDKYNNNSTKLFCWGYEGEFPQTIYSFGQPVTNAVLVTGSAVNNYLRPKEVDYFNSGFPRGKVIKDFISTPAVKCFLTDDGELWCWGYTGHAQTPHTKTEDCYVLGSDYACSRKIQKIEGLPAVKSLHGLNYQTCAITTLDHLYCWGNNGLKQLGITGDDTCDALAQGYGSPTTECQKTPKRVGSFDKVTSVGFTDLDMCFVNDGEIYCSGHFSGSTTPTKNTLLGNDNVEVSMMVGNTNRSIMALKSDGTYIATGANDYGQLGDSTKVDKLTSTVSPFSNTEIKFISSYSIIAGFASQRTTCIVESNGGALKCWINERNNHLGNGAPNTDTGVPTSIPNHSSDVEQVALGLGYICTLTVSGRLQCWGANYGGTGNGLIDGTTSSPTDAALTF